MAYLLRSLLILMMTGIILTILTAQGMNFPYSHIEVAIPAFLFLIFAQAFIMFYFIGTSRLAENVYNVIKSETNLSELFEEPPADLKPYLGKTKRFAYEAGLGKRQTMPWTILMLVLGMIAFLLGGAHDTGLVSKVIHSGVVYGFCAAMIIGFFRQWYYLGKTHKLLRKLKTLFSIPDSMM